MSLFSLFSPHLLQMCPPRINDDLNFLKRRQHVGERWVDRGMRQNHFVRRGDIVPQKTNAVKTSKVVNFLEKNGKFKYDCIFYVCLKNRLTFATSFRII